MTEHRPRMLALHAAAIRLVIRRRYRAPLTEVDSLALAALGSVEAAVHQFDAARRVPLSASGHRLSAASMTTLAVMEAVVAASPLAEAPRERLERRQALTAALAKAEAAAGRVAADTVAVEQMIKQEEVHGIEFRRFLRRVGDLRRAQIRKVTLAIADPDTRTGILEALDAVYHRVLRQATGVMRE